MLRLIDKLKQRRKEKYTLGFHHYTADFPQIRTPQARQGFFEPEQFERSSGKAVTGHTGDQMYERYGIRTVSDVAPAMLSVQDYRDQLSRKRQSVIF